MVSAYNINLDSHNIMLNRTRKLVKTVGATALTYSAAATAAMAQTPVVPNVGPGGDLLSWIQNAINLAIGLASLVAVIYLVYSGFTYIMAAGDEGKVEKATKGITYAVTGLVICFISVLIVNFVLQYVIGS